VAIKLYWWSGGRGESPTNFGDSISPLLVRELAGKPVEFAPLHRCELIAAGSLLNMAIRSQWRRTVSLRLTPIKVWGTGSLDAKRLDRRHRLDIFAVRGPETRDALGLPPGTPLGDPGLLLSQLVGPVERVCRWAIIPHYVDFH
jgi:hypothetical protein